MACDSTEFLTNFFRELERRSIPYVILHSYQELPETIASDIDFAVPSSQLPTLKVIQTELARKCGWALVQTLQHGVFAFYSVLVNLENPTDNLRLDACSNYARARRFLVSERVLLENRVAYRGFFIPAPPAEFIYVLAKLFDAKKKSPASYLPRLKELYLKDPNTAQQYFNGLFGDTGLGLGEWFERPSEEWRRLGEIMLSRNRFGPALCLKEMARLARRVFQPTGMSIAILGSDGAGKSTLIDRLRVLLEPCFRYQKVLHSRPGVLQKRTPAPVTDPHGKPPRNVLLSWLKVAYYFVDHWAGWFLIVLPARIRSTLVIFDRTFDDLLVDQRRYRLSGTTVLADALRRLVPRADRTFILSAPAPVLRRRKPEVDEKELERQQGTLLRLAQNRSGYVLVSAEQPPEQVANEVCREVARFLAVREEQR